MGDRMSSYDAEFLSWRIAMSIVVTHLFADCLQRTGQPGGEARHLLNQWLAAADMLELGDADEDALAGSALAHDVRESLERLVVDAVKLAEDDPRSRRPLRS
jgi:hypothetical protein